MQHSKDELSNPCEPGTLLGLEPSILTGGDHCGDGVIPQLHLQDRDADVWTVG